MTVKVEWVTTTCGCGCGVTFRQLRDPGREREYLNNAHKQRAYRARNPHRSHSGTRRETPSARRRREQEEAWAREEARKEQERQRAHRRRHGAPPPPPRGMGAYGWTMREQATDTAAQRKQRRLCYTLVYKGLRPDTPAGEAESCLRMAERKRVKYGL